MKNHIVGGIVRDVSSVASTGVVLMLAVLGAASIFGAVLLGRKRWANGSTLVWLGCLASVALIVSVTILREGLAFGFDLGRLSEWSSDGYTALSRDPLRSSQFQLNVLLFLPAGVAWTWLIRKPFLVAVALSASSILIECTQAIIGVGANDVGDIAANALGALIGVGLATAAAGTGVNATAQEAHGRRARILVGVAVVAGIVAAGLFVGASHRQTVVRNELESKFAGTDRRSIALVIEADSELVWSAVEGARTSGASDTDTSLEVRYPATFFSLSRCVLVKWTEQDVTFENASGRRCTEFIG